MNEYVVWLNELGMHDVERVGGKNASLGEMIRNLAGLGVQVPGGFATTAHAYREFLAHGGLTDKINAALASLDVDDVGALTRTGAQIRQWVMESPFQPALDRAVGEGYARLEAEYGTYFKVARLFAQVIGRPALMRELTRVGMRSHTLMDWVLRIMANLLREDEVGPAEAVYRSAATVANVLPEPSVA